MADETDPAFCITPGQAAEYAQAISLLEGREAEAVITDKGYDSAEIVAKAESLGQFQTRAGNLKVKSGC